MSGSLITTDWQMEREGLLTGDRTVYDLVQIDGLAGMPSVKAQDRPLLLRHGSVPGLDFLGERIVTLSYEIVDDTPSSLSAIMTALSTAFQTSEGELGLYFQLPGVAGGVKAVIEARVRQRDTPIDLKFTRGVATVDVQLVASDPRIYQAAQSTDTTGLTTVGGGLTFNAVANFVFGDPVSGDTLTLLNTGTIEAPVVFRIDGPVTNPTITNVATDQSLGFSLTLADGTFLLVDTEARTILLGGTASRYSSLDNGSEWFAAKPGSTEVRFSASTATDALLTAAWRNAWG